MNHAEACLAIDLEVAQADSVWLQGPHEGYHCATVDDHLRIVVGSAQTGGRVAMAELRVAPRSGPPLHTHPCAEAFYVLWGSFEFTGWSEGALRTVVGEPGSVVVVPGGAVHTFRSGSEGGSAVALATPATIELMFRQGGEPVGPAQFGRFEGLESSPDLARMFAAAALVGLELVDPTQLEQPADAPEVRFYPPSSGERLWILGDSMRLIADDPASGIYIQVDEIAPGAGTPPHTHPADEYFYVLEGELWFLSLQDGEPAFHCGTPGTMAYVPGGVVHCFQNRGEQPAKFVMLTTDDRMASFFREVGLPLAAEEPAPQRPPTDQEIERVLGVAVGTYEMTFPVVM